MDDGTMTWQDLFLHCIFKVLKAVFWWCQTPAEREDELGLSDGISSSAENKSELEKETLDHKINIEDRSWAKSQT